VSKAGLVGLKSAAVSFLLGALFLIVSRLLHFASEGLFGLMVIMVFAASSSAYKEGLKEQRAGTGQ